MLKATSFDNRATMIDPRLVSPRGNQAAANLGAELISLADFGEFANPQGTECVEIMKSFQTFMSLVREPKKKSLETMDQKYNLIQMQLF